MIIRIATKEDIACCSDILSNSKIGKTYYPTKKIIAHALEKALENDVVYVSENEDGKITGFIWFTLNGAFASYPYLHIICVSKDCRHTGIGKELLSFYEHYCLEKTKKFASKSYLVVADFNNNAYNFYLNKGYKQVATLDSLFRNNVTEKLMCKEINTTQFNVKEAQTAIAS